MDIFQIVQQSSWKFKLGNMKDEMIDLVPDDMLKSNISRQGKKLCMTWEGHPVYGKDFTITAVWEKTGEDLYSGNLSYSGYGGSLFVEEIYFPVSVVPFSAGQHLVYGGWDIGKNEEITLEQANEEGVIFDRLCTCMQFTALVNKAGDNFYIDHRDPAHTCKRINISRAEGENLAVSAVYINGNGKTPSAEGKIPYSSTIGVFSGSWFDACQIYKKWAQEQPWVINRAERSNPLRGISMWVWNRGNSSDIVPPVLKLKQDLGNIPVALDWYWWHRNPYDAEVPDHWPPREGEDKFKSVIADLKKKGIFTQVYIAAAGWDVEYKGWNPEYNKELVWDRGTGIRLRVANRYMGNKIGRVCGEASVFHDKISSLARNISSCGLDALYLDVVGCATYSPCYNPSHSHPMGGGSFGVDGYRKMIKRIQKENPHLILTTECCNEAYMDVVEGGIVINMSCERIGEAKDISPLFPAVYHGGMALYGNYCMPDGVPPWDELWPQEGKWENEDPWHRIYPDQFFIDLARCAVWGVQPMVCNLLEHIVSDPEYADIYKFILDTAKLHHSSLEYLFDGEMLSPDGFFCEEHETDFMKRLVYTTKERLRIIHKTLPAILHGVWQTPAGEKALFLANWTGSTQSWQYKDLSGKMKPRSYLKVDLQ